MESKAQPMSQTQEYEARLDQDELDEIVAAHVNYLEGSMGGKRAILKNTDLSGLKLKDKDLRQASFTNCGMTGMDLSGTDFQEASLYACDLSYCNLKRTKFTRADMRGAKIEYAMLEEANLEKADLRTGGVSADSSFNKGDAVTFIGANLAGAKMTGVMATQADFSDAILVGVNLNGANMKDAKLEGADLSDANIVGAQFEGASLRSAILTGVEMGELKSSKIDLEEAITDDNAGKSVANLKEPLFKLIEKHRMWVQTAGKVGEQLDLSNVDMRGMKSLQREKLTAIKAINAKFFSMNLSEIEMQSAVLNGSDFRNVRFEASDLRGSLFQNCQFSHAKMRRVVASPLVIGGGDKKREVPCNFSGGVFRYADLSGGDFRQVNFVGADLSYANLTNCNLEGADFSEANLKGTNFDGAKLDNAKINRA